MGEITDIRAAVSQADDALMNAESCETPEDFDANIEAALDSLKEAIDAIKETRKL